MGPLRPIGGRPPGTGGRPWPLSPARPRAIGTRSTGPARAVPRCSGPAGPRSPLLPPPGALLGPRTGGGIGLPVKGDTGPRKPGGGGMGLPVMGDKAPRFCGPAAGPGAGAGRGVPAAPGRTAGGTARGREGRDAPAPTGSPVRRWPPRAGWVLADRSGRRAQRAAGGALTTDLGPGPGLPTPVGSGEGQHRGASTDCAVRWRPDPGGGVTPARRLGAATGRGPAVAAVTGAPDARSGGNALGPRTAPSRWPCRGGRTCAAWTRSGGGPQATLRPGAEWTWSRPPCARPATASACRPAGTVAAGLPARDEVSVCTGADKERPETGAGRSCSGAGSSG